VNFVATSLDISSRAINKYHYKPSVDAKQW